MCDARSCEGAVLWRGHFTATGKETAVRLVINGGEGSCDDNLLYVYLTSLCYSVRRVCLYQ